MTDVFFETKFVVDSTGTSDAFLTAQGVYSWENTTL